MASGIPRNTQIRGTILELHEKRHQYISPEDINMVTVTVAERRMYV